MSSQRRFRISLFRHPVSSSRRIAAIAGGNTEKSASASSSTRPRRRHSSAVRTRSRRRSLYMRTNRHGFRRAGIIPQAIPRENIFDSTRTTWFAWYGLSPSASCSART